jgi:hypothetical protein
MLRQDQRDELVFEDARLRELGLLEPDQPTCWQSATTDFDGNSEATASYWGIRGTTVQRPLMGMWREGGINTQVFQLSGGTVGQIGGDLQVRANKQLGGLIDEAEGRLGP